MRLSIPNKTAPKRVLRLKKKLRIRNRIEGSAERPRLSIYRSLRQISVQLVDDTVGKTLVAASTSSLSVKSKTNLEAAKALGAEVAKLAKAKNINAVVFDRNGYLYHGRVKAVAESAREAGLQF
jgi:large subunit ribosomal protein L18